MSLHGAPLADEDAREDTERTRRNGGVRTPGCPRPRVPDDENGTALHHQGLGLPLVERSVLFTTRQWTVSSRGQ